MNTRENFWNGYCFIINQMRDETAKDTRQTTALNSHNLMQNVLAFSGLGPYTRWTCFCELLIARKLRNLTKDVIFLALLVISRLTMGKTKNAQSEGRKRLRENGSQTDEDSLQEETLYPVLKKAKQEKNTAFFKVDRLIINGQVYRGIETNNLPFYGSIM